MASLFEPASMGNIQVENRVFMAPLTRNRASAEGIPHPLTAQYYAQRASAGLIVTEATQISPQGKGYLDTPGIHSLEQIKAWKEVTDAVHEKSGKIVLQLWHVGRISHTSLLPDGEVPVAPSAIRAQSQTFTETGMTDVSEPRALSIDEIKSVIADYAKAAQNAKDAGFDGIEIHGANGYLIDQFLQDKTNTRTDEYGGSAENRTRFLAEIIEAVLTIWDAANVGVRLSPTGTFNDMGDSNPLETFGTVIDKINTYNLAYLHMVEKFPGIETGDTQDQIVKTLRAKWNGFYISNGNYDRESAIEAIENDYADAITFGRPFISNPDLPKRLEIGAELTEADESTFYGGGAEGYTDYPFLDEAQAA